MATTRKLIVRSLDELTRGNSDGGREWTLWKVTATTATGTPVLVPLRSFERLPTGEVLELEVERRDDARGVSYTLRRPRRRGASAAGLADLAAKLDALERRVGRLEQPARRAA